jgi:gamma-glutamyltranspeptidase/glutathione hydrolase
LGCAGARAFGLGWAGDGAGRAQGDLFLRNGEPIPFGEAVEGGRGVGVPGVLRMLEAAHRAHGRLPWAQLFQPAIQRAEEGFAVSARLSRDIASAEAALARDPGARALFLLDGRAPAEGALMRNPGARRHAARGGRAGGGRAASRADRQRHGARGPRPPRRIAG